MYDDKLGLLKKGTTVEVVDHKAEFYIRRGVANATVIVADVTVIVEEQSNEQIDVQPVKKRTKKTKVIED